MVRFQIKDVYIINRTEINIKTCFYQNCPCISSFYLLLIIVMKHISRETTGIERTYVSTRPYEK